MNSHRYNRAGDDVIGMFPGMMRHPQGKWVKYDSYAALQSSNSALREALQKVANLNENAGEIGPSRSG